jgi:hypothetical protein
MRKHEITDRDVEAWARSLSPQEVREAAVRLMVQQHPDVVVEIVAEVQGREEAAFAGRELVQQMGRRLGRKKMIALFDNPA